MAHHFHEDAEYRPLLQRGRDADSLSPVSSIGSFFERRRNAERHASIGECEWAYEYMDPSVLPEGWRLMYTQLVNDEGNDLLINGYLHLHGIPTHGIANIIASYYTKSFSVDELHEAYLRSKQECQRKADKRAEIRGKCAEIMKKTVVIFPLFAPDIAAIYIGYMRDCDDAVAEDHGVGVSDFLIIGSLVHLTGYTFLLIVWNLIDREWLRLCVMSMYGVMQVFLLGWNITGINLFSEMMHSKSVNRQCYGIAISIVTIRFVEMSCVALGAILLDNAFRQRL